MTTTTPQPDFSDDEIAAVTADEQSILAALGRAWWVVLILGLISLVVGIVLLVKPFTAVNVAAIIFGVWLLVSGIFQLVQAFNSRLETIARVMNAITGVVGIILGIICFESVENRIGLLILFLGIWWILRGIMQIIMGASQGSGRGVDIFLGVLGVVAGAVVLIWPIESLTVLTLVAGIWLVVLGVLEIVASFRVRTLNRRADA